MPSLVPVAQVAVLAALDADFVGVEGRMAGLELRDTILVLSPGPRSSFVLLFRKPIVAGTVAAQVVTTGTGALNIDLCRVATTENLNGGAYSASGRAVKMAGDRREGASLGMYASGFGKQSRGAPRQGPRVALLPAVADEGEMRAWIERLVGGSG